MNYWIKYLKPALYLCGFMTVLFAIMFVYVVLLLLAMVLKERGNLTTSLLITGCLFISLPFVMSLFKLLGDYIIDKTS